VRAALADSTAYAFVARGVHTLRGIREPAELFALERRPASG
jgi:class 3 adenylate cyclase